MQASQTIILNQDKSEITLLIAAEKGNFGMVNDLLCRRVNPNARREESNQTPLMLAALQGHKEIVELLLKNGADVNTKDSSGWTALMHSVDTPVIKLLLKAGANIISKANDGCTALRLAREERLRLVQKILVISMLKNRKAPLREQGRRMRV